MNTTLSHTFESDNTPMNTYNTQLNCQLFEICMADTPPHGNVNKFNMNLVFSFVCHNNAIVYSITLTTCGKQQSVAMVMFVMMQARSWPGDHS